VALSTLLRSEYLLRRDKTQKGVVEQLPKKTDNIVFCELRPAQRRAYKRLTESPDVQVGCQGGGGWVGWGAAVWGWFQGWGRGVGTLYVQSPSA